MAINKQVNLHIVLVKPPAGVPYALQKGSGNNFTLEQPQTSTGGDLLFTCAVGVKPGKDGWPDFNGPFVQGPAGERFVYIGIGAFAGVAGSTWQRRLKIPLRGITNAMLDAKDDAGAVITTLVEATDKKGEPTCATPKPFEGWRLVDQLRG